MSKKKNTGGYVYSTNPDFNLDEPESFSETQSPDLQKLIVQKSVKGRGGKVATLVTGFVGKAGDLEQLGKMLKNKCGTGGSVKDNEIIIQGDLRQKVAEILQKEGYKVKISGG